MSFSILNSVKKIINFRRIGDALEKEYAETSGDQVKLTTTGENGITQGDAQAEFVAVHTKINAVSNALVNKPGSRVVANIAARDALTIAGDNVATGYICYVKNATDDATVSTGAAVYIASVDGDPATITWEKFAEYESLDRVIDWGEITNKEKDVVHVATTPTAMPEGLADGGLCIVDVASV